MKIIIVSIAGLFSINSLFAQAHVTIADSASHQIIPYANIQMKDSDLGVSSSELGTFEFTDQMREGTLVISAIGYHTKEIHAVTNDTIFLKASPIEVPEVIVSAPKGQIQIEVGSYKKNKKGVGYGAGNKQPWILARYFPYELKYEKTPYVRTITLETRSMIKDAKFMIRLYKRNTNGEPGDFLYDKPIFASAKKGTNNTVIDLSEYKIAFPEEGLFVAMEFLTLESNKYTFTANDMGSKKSYKSFDYQPSFISLPCDTNDMSMVYHKGRWEKMHLNTVSSFGQQYMNKYNIFAVALTLVN